MKTIQNWLREANVWRPMSLDNLYKTGATYAKRLNVDKDIAKDELVWANKQRRQFMEIVWNACMREVKPSGFNSKAAMTGCNASLQSFYAAEAKVDKYSPPAWRNAVIDWLIQSIAKNEEKWIQSRYEFVKDNSGKDCIKNLW